MFAAVLGQFAAHEVERLNAVGAFVDLGDPGIAGELGHAPFFDIAVAAVDLLGFHGHVVALVGQEAFDDRGEQRHKAVGVFVVGAVGRVDHGGTPEDEGAGGFDKAFLVHQRAADVGVHDQRVGGFVGEFRPGHRAALQAVVGVDHGVLVGDFGLCQTLHADADAGFVHHGEHGAHALVLGPQQIAGGTVVVHHAGRVAVDAHLLFDGADGDAVALTQGAVFVHHELGHDEERHAFDAFGAAFDLGQHQMDDVVGHVVFTRRDEDFLAGDLVAAIVLRRGFGAH